MLPRDLVVVHRLDSIYERYDLSLSWLGMVCRFEVRFASSFVSVVIDMYIYIYMDNWNRIYEIKFVYIHMCNCYI